MKRLKGSFKYVYLALMLVFLYLPILYLIVFSFNDFSSGRRTSYANLGLWKGFTLANYSNLFSGEAGSALLLTIERIIQMTAGVSSTTLKLSLPCARAIYGLRSVRYAHLFAERGCCMHSMH